MAGGMIGWCWWCCEVVVVIIAPPAELLTNRTDLLLNSLIHLLWNGFGFTFFFAIFQVFKIGNLYVIVTNFRCARFENFLINCDYMGLVEDLILIWISQPLRRTTMSWIELIWVRVVLVTINNHRLSAIPAERRFKYVGRLQVKWARLALESETESLSQSFAFAHVLPSQPSLSLSFCSSRGSFPQYLNVPVSQYPYLCVGLVRSVCVSLGCR